MRQGWGWSQTGKGDGRVLERAAPGGNSVGQEEAVARKKSSVSTLFILGKGSKDGPWCARASRALRRAACAQTHRFQMALQQRSQLRRS